MSMRSLMVFFFCVLTVAFSSSRAGAEDIGGRFAVGLNYPGVSVKYGFNSMLALEGRYQSDSNIGVMGPRLYCVLKQYNNINLIAGMEADYVTFTGQVSKGTGYAAEVFIGGECFINHNLSFQIDIGPATVSLSDSATSQSISGLDTVLNMGVNYYFGKGNNKTCAEEGK